MPLPCLLTRDGPFEANIFCLSSDLPSLAMKGSSLGMVSFSFLAMFCDWVSVMKLTLYAATVVRNPEDASGVRDGAFDYVVLCVKALPDVYDLAAVIDAVVTPQHTCILINTTHTLGVEAAIEERFPTNVVLSLVSGAELTQLGPSEFEHKGSTDVWVGPANKNGAIPQSIQEDMAQALAMTLSTGQVQCKVSHNIRQQQYERVIGYVIISPPPKQLTRFW